jgi:hypothetical protein
MLDRRAGSGPQKRRPRVIACLAGVLAVVFASGLTGVAPAEQATRTAALTVRAVNVDSGRISAVAVVGARGRYRLSVPAGAYLVVRSKIHANGGFSDSVDRLAVVRAAARDRVGRAAAERPVVTIGKVTLGPADGVPGRTRGVGALVLRDLFKPLTDRGISFVDTSAQVVATSKREQQLYDDGRSATPVNYDPLKAAYEITGDGTQLSDGQVTMTLNLKNLVTGQVVATKTVTGNGRSFGQLEGLFGELTAEFAGDASQVIDESPTGGAVTVDLAVTFLMESFGSGSVTASPPGHTFHKGETDTYEFKVAGGTAVSLQAKPDAGSYFVGWQSGSECGATEFQSSALEYSCTVSDPGDGRFAIDAGANFDSCPKPGTYVVNAPNEAVCPGVTVVNN